MVRVKNVKVSNGRLYVDYRYEDDDDVGSVVMDVKTGEIVDVSFNSRDKKYDGGYTFSKVIQFMRKMIKYNKFPSEASWIWY
jgi:hypothetical protein